jgi:hypothetical protein
MQDLVASGMQRALLGVLHTSAYVSIRQHTLAYVSIRQHTSVHAGSSSRRLAYVSIRQHTSAYVSIRQRMQGALLGVLLHSASASEFVLLYQ